MQLSDVNLTDPDIFQRGTPHHMFKLLRREAPVFWHPETNGDGFWVITKYADLREVSKNPGLFSAIRLWVDKARSIPVQTRLTEPTGDHTTIRFEKVQVNQPLPKDAFLLKLPKDVTEVE